MKHFVFIISIGIALFSPSLITGTERFWEVWDTENVSEIIDNYWHSSKEEIEHRLLLKGLSSHWISPEDTFLEVGSGTGMVYDELVPDVLPNDHYVGVDITVKMLEIASLRFPQGTFIKDDLYNLSFKDSAFDVVAAYEVFGHIDDIIKPISEMFRVAKKRAIFTVWTSPETLLSHEFIGSCQFNHRSFAIRDVLDSIHSALMNKSYEVTQEPLSHNITAFIIKKDDVKLTLEH